MAVEDMRVMGRATQGVRLIKLGEEDEIAAVAKVEITAEDNEALAEIDDLEAAKAEEAAQEIANEDDTSPEEEKSEEENDENIPE